MPQLNWITLNLKKHGLNPWGTLGQLPNELQFQVASKVLVDRLKQVMDRLVDE